MSAELEAAVKELEAVIVPAEKAEVIEKSLVDRLVSMNSRMTELVSRLIPGRGEKLVKAKAFEGKETAEEEALEEDEKKKKDDDMESEKSATRSISAQETLSKSLAVSEPYQEVVEASQALRDLEQGISKSLGQIEKSNTDQFNRIEKSLADLASAMALICTAQATIKKSFDAQPRSQPMLGYLGTISKGNGATAHHNEARNRDDISLKLQQIVQEGKANPAILSKFDTQPNAALGMLSSDLKKSYGIPDSL